MNVPTIRNAATPAFLEFVETTLPYVHSAANMDDEARAARVQQSVRDAYARAAKGHVLDGARTFAADLRDWRTSEDARSRLRWAMLDALANLLREK